MNRFVNSIKRSIESENWFAALFLALSLPDICSSLESSAQNRKVGKEYKAWFNKYLKRHYDLQADTIFEDISKHPKISIETAKQLAQQFSKSITPFPFTAEDCYRLRCKCLHQGISETNSYERIHFTVPGQGVIHKNILVTENGEILQLSIDIFCEDICSAVEKWAINVKNNIEVQKRIQNLIQMYETGDAVFPIASH